MAIHARAAALAVALLSSAVPGCALFPVGHDVRPGSSAPRCSGGVCLEVVSFASLYRVVGLWLEAPPGTQLVNAHFLPDATPPCQGDMSLEWVTIDETTVRKGPLDVGGKHGLALGFPSDAWSVPSDFRGQMVVDLELNAAGEPRCLRAPLTDVDERRAVGQ